MIKRGRGSLLYRSHETVERMYKAFVSLVKKDQLTAYISCHTLVVGWPSVHRAQVKGHSQYCGV